jgi:nitrogen-specific signal transduction histidine kinase
MTNNSLNEGLIRTDSDGIIEYVNLAFIKLIGMDEWMLSSKARPGSAHSGSGSQTAELMSSSSSASESASTDDDDQNVSLMTTLVGTPIDDLLQLIQVVIQERSPAMSASDTAGSTTVTDHSLTPAHKSEEKSLISSRSASPLATESASDTGTDTKVDSTTTTDDDIFDDGFSYKTTLVDMKSMIKRTVVTKDTMTLADNKFHNACHEDMYSDVLTQDMVDIVNFQLGEPDLGRNIGYLIRRGGQTAVVAVEVSVNPLQRISYKRSKARAHSKNTDGVVLVFRNMTDVMRTQSANRQLADKSRWISVITHEMRSLVNGIIGMLDLVKTTELSKEQTGLVDCMEVSANALICLVSNTLDHARLEAGKVSLEYLPFNMQERLRIVVDLMNMMATAKDVKFSSEIDEDVPETMYSDFNRLFQILLNLTSNAIKFSSHKRKRSKQGQVKLIVKKVDEEYKAMSPLANHHDEPLKASKFASMLSAEHESMKTNHQRYASMLASDKYPHILTSTPSPSMFPYFLMYVFMKTIVVQWHLLWHTCFFLPSLAYFLFSSRC